MTTNFYPCTSLTGGGAGALDAIDGADLSDGDVALVVNSTSAYLYYLSASSGSAESSPGIISPDDNAGDKRWILANFYSSEFVSISTASGGLESLTVTTSASLTAQQCRGVAINNFGQGAAITPVLPTCAEGLHGKVCILTTGYAFHLDIQAADISYLDGTLLDAGDKISNVTPAIDDELYFEAVLKTGGGYRWKFTTGLGNWIDGG